MFVRFTLRALRHRKQRLLLSFAALAVAATLATVLFGIYGGVEQHVREEFGRYGANLIAVPAVGNTLPLEVAARAEQLGSQAAPFLVASVRAQSKLIPVAGFIPGKVSELDRYWHVRGRIPAAANECLAGALLQKENLPCQITGVVETGGVEDGELLVPYAAAERLAGLTGVASVIQIRAPGERIDDIRAQLAREFPAADIRTVRSVAGTETAVVTKIRAALFLLTLLILTITTLCVSSNFSEMVIERGKEIGILKALGAAERRIATFFVSESAALALSASVAGYGLGIFAAAAIARTIFATAFELEPNLLVFLCVSAVMLAVAGIATAIAASGIWRIQPAVILRGE